MVYETRAAETSSDRRFPGWIPASKAAGPLAKPDADISLNIQPMIASIYKRSRYK
jgi:hypothetical protein